MNAAELVTRICTELDGVLPMARWGETALFYNPGRVLPHGVYFCTLKERDGAHDRASRLDRDGVFRVSIGLGPARYGRLFGERPARPPKGGIVATGHDFTRVNVLMPHPIYAWMGWAQILSPSAEALEGIFPLIREAHAAAELKFRKNTGPAR